MTEQSITREGFLAQWANYGYSPEKVSQLMQQGRITHKDVFRDFAHWYLDGYVMFAEYEDATGFHYIRYRKEITWDAH